MKKLIIITLMFFGLFAQAQTKLKYIRWQEVTTAERNDIPVMDNTVVYEVYNVDTSRYETYNGTAWVSSTGTASTIEASPYLSIGSTTIQGWLNELKDELDDLSLSAGTVTSVFGRSGAINSAEGDYNAEQIDETASRVFLSPTEKANFNTSFSWGNHPTLLSQFTNDVPYLTTAGLSNYVTLNSDQIITGPKTINTAGLKNLDIINSATGSGSGSSGLNISNTKLGFGLYITNSGAGSGSYISNDNTGTGFFLKNQSAGIGASFSNFSTGAALSLDGEASSTGFLLRGRNSSTNTFTLDKEGNIIANSININGDGSNVMLDNGTVTPLSGLSGGGGATQTLDEVLEEGNETARNIVLTSNAYVRNYNTDILTPNYAESNGLRYLITGTNGTSEIGQAYVTTTASGSQNLFQINAPDGRIYMRGGLGSTSYINLETYAAPYVWTMPLASGRLITSTQSDALYKPIGYVPAWADITGKPTLDGSETKVTAGTNVTVTGTGTTASPYVVNSTASGSGHTIQDNGVSKTVRTNLNFKNFVVDDNAGNNSTDITAVVAGAPLTYDYTAVGAETSINTGVAIASNYQTEIYYGNAVLSPTIDYTLSYGATTTINFTFALEAGYPIRVVYNSSSAPNAITDTDDVPEGTTNLYADSNATNQGNTFNGANQLVKLDGTGKLPAIDGSLLTNLPSSSLSLDDVLNNGSVSQEKFIEIGGLRLFDDANETYGELKYSDSQLSFENSEGHEVVFFDYNGDMTLYDLQNNFITKFSIGNKLSANRILNIPDASGTIAIEADASGFNGNLTTTDNTLQEIAQKFDDFVGGAPEGTAIKSTGETGGNKFLREDGDGTSSWQTISGGGDMLKSENLSGLANYTTARSNLGLVIGTNVLAPNGSASGLTGFPTLNQNTTGSAATLTTARTINGTSFNGSANITTTNWGTSRNLSIGGTSKAVTGGADVTWSQSEIGVNKTTIDALGINATAVGGVTVSGTPTTGQVPVATSGTTATWQTPSGGGGSTLSASTIITNPVITGGVFQQTLVPAQGAGKIIMIKSFNCVSLNVAAATGNSNAQLRYNGNSTNIGSQTIMLASGSTYVLNGFNGGSIINSTALANTSLNAVISNTVDQTLTGDFHFYVEYLIFDTTTGF